MSCTEQKGEVTMYKRTLKALLVVAVLAVAIPVQAALAMPTSDSGGAVVAASTATQPAQRVVVSSDTGFNWGDAAIGAGVMLGTVVAAVAASAALRRHDAHLAH
jgi:hypothetical protein